MFRYWKERDNQNAIIKALWIVIALLVVINVVTLMGWRSAPTKLRCYIPPDISGGAWIQPGKVNKSTVYAFAFQIFTAINSWTDSGEKNYANNIHQYRQYLTPRFHATLTHDVAVRHHNGELMRRRIVSGLSGMGYSPSTVTDLGNGTWRVNMVLHLVETVDTQVVKDAEIQYSVFVQRVNASININRWGLQLAGFASRPQRKKTLTTAEGVHA